MQKSENNWFQEYKTLKTKTMEKNKEISDLNEKIRKLERKEALKQLKEESY